LNKGGLEGGKERIGGKMEGEGAGQRGGGDQNPTKAQFFCGRHWRWGKARNRRGILEVSFARSDFGSGFAAMKVGMIRLVKPSQGREREQKEKGRLGEGQKTKGNKGVGNDLKRKGG